MRCLKANCISRQFHPVLQTLAQVVAVDYYMPGCPPESHQIAAVIDLVIKVVHGEAELPPDGAVIGVGDSTVCDECPRRSNVKKIKEFVRIQDVDPMDPTLCLLEQGIPCNGPATRRDATRCAHKPAHSASVVTARPKA